jgi:hypothetical protein
MASTRLLKGVGLASRRQEGIALGEHGRFGHKFEVFELPQVRSITGSN